MTWICRLFRYTNKEILPSPVFCVCRIQRSCAGTWESQEMLCFLWRGTFPPTSASTLTWTRKSPLFATVLTDYFFCNVSESSLSDLWCYEILHACLFLNFPLGREDFCLAETQKEWCRSGTRTQFRPMVMRNFFNLCLGSGRTGTAPTASGNTVQHLPAPKAMFHFLYFVRILELGIFKLHYLSITR